VRRCEATDVAGEMVSGELSAGRVAREGANLETVWPQRHETEEIVNLITFAHGGFDLQ
jgi:hypothetical protein